MNYKLQHSNYTYQTKNGCESSIFIVRERKPCKESINKVQYKWNI